jgi:hypothetical protein
VDLVYEQHHPATSGVHIRQQRLEPLLKFAAVAAASHQRSHVQGYHPLAGQPAGEDVLACVVGGVGEWR